MSTPRDVLQLKPDAELRFFVESPGTYPPELVAAAQQKLRWPLARSYPTGQHCCAAHEAAPGTCSPVVDNVPTRRP